MNIRGTHLIAGVFGSSLAASKLSFRRTAQPNCLALYPTTGLRDLGGRNQPSPWFGACSQPLGPIPPPLTVDPLEGAAVSAFGTGDIGELCAGCCLEATRM